MLLKDSNCSLLLFDCSVHICSGDSKNGNETVLFNMHVCNARWNGNVGMGLPSGDYTIILVQLPFFNEAS